MYVSFWATHGWQYWCLESVYKKWTSSSPPPAPPVKTIQEEDYDEFAHTKHRSTRIFDSVDLDRNGHIEDHELHYEIIGISVCFLACFFFEFGKGTTGSADLLIWGFIGLGIDVI